MRENSNKNQILFKVNAISKGVFCFPTYLLYEKLTLTRGKVEAILSNRLEEGRWC